MNLFVADPEWGWWIILYFYCGGLAAGLYFLATLVELFGKDEDRPLSVIGYRLAIPLISLCGIFLIVDLDRPERFHHMLFQSERLHGAFEAGWPLGGWGDMLYAPMFKWWSPMSVGAWAIAVFGALAFLSFLGTLWPDWGIAKALTGRGLLGRIFQVCGSAVGFFVASYTGVLLTASNQPVWSDSSWIGPLFLTSAASTSLAALLLLGHWVWPLSRATMQRLERADLWALGLELFVFLIFLASLGPSLPWTLHTPAGLTLIVGTLFIGLIVPLALHVGLGAGTPWRSPAAALCALVGGFLLRFGIVRTPPELLIQYGGEATSLTLVPLWQTWEGILLLVLTVALAVAIPLVLRGQWRLGTQETALAGAVSVLVLLGVVAYAVQGPPDHVGSPTAWVRWEPEDGRPVGGGLGGSYLNQPDQFRLRTKIPAEQ